jgi:hypothetical protein
MLMKRREFIALLGAGGLLLAVQVRRVRAQQPRRCPLYVRVAPKAVKRTSVYGSNVPDPDMTLTG